MKSLWSRIEAILIANLLNLKETAMCTNIRLDDISHTIHNSGVDCTRDTVVVSLSNTAECRDIALEEVMLSKVLRPNIITIILLIWRGEGSGGFRGTYQILPSR